VKVVVLTTSYPRFAGDAAGRFVADAVRHVRAAGVDVEVQARDEVARAAEREELVEVSSVRLQHEPPSTCGGRGRCRVRLPSSLFIVVAAARRSDGTFR